MMLIRNVTQYYKEIKSEEFCFYNCLSIGGN